MELIVVGVASAIVTVVVPSPPALALELLFVRCVAVGSGETRLLLPVEGTFAVVVALVSRDWSGVSSSVVNKVVSVSSSVGGLSWFLDAISGTDTFPCLGAVSELVDVGGS